MDRDELVDALTRFLQQASGAGGNPQAVLDPSGLDLAGRLAAVAESTDVESAHLIGWLHWMRYQRLPDSQGQDGLHTALSIFANLLPIDANLVPEPLRPALAVAADSQRAAIQGIDLVDLNNQAVQLLRDPNNNVDVSALNNAVDWLRQTVAGTSTYHPNRAGYLSNLGAALRTRHKLTGDVADLHDAVKVSRAAVAAAPSDGFDRAGFLSNLGLSLKNRYERTGEVADLLEAIDLYRLAVATAPTDDVDRPAIVSKLGNALHAQYERTGELADLNDAIDLGRSAVAAAWIDDPDRTGYLSNLGVALDARFQRTGEMADLTEAIHVGRDALAATPSDHPDRATILSTLASMLHVRHKHTGDRTDLTEAVDLGWIAVAATPTEHPDRAGRLSNLANTLRILYDRTGEPANIDQSVDMARQAVLATPTDHPHRARYMSILTATLGTRHERSGDLKDLNEAVEVGRSAVAATSTAYPEKAGPAANLAAALQTRYERTAQLGDLHEAIDLLREAIAATPIDHPEQARYMSNVAAALHKRYQYTNDLNDLNEAVHMTRRAIAATPPDNPDRSGRLSNLGAALSTRFDRTGVMADLDEAVRVGREAVAAIPTDHPDRAGRLSNLGGSLRSRHERTRVESDRVAAATAFRDGAGIVTAPPMVRMRCGRSWLEMAASAGRWPDAQHALHDVLDLLPLLVEPTLAMTDRHYRLEQLQGLGSDAARAAMGNLNRRRRWRHRAQHAWTVLEDGRGVLLHQALASRTDTSRLRATHPQLADQLDQLRTQLAHTSTPLHGLPGTGARSDQARRADDEARTRRARDIYQRLDALLTSIRRQRGFTRLGLPPTLNELRAAGVGGTIVGLTVTGLGCGALILTRRHADYLALPELTAETAVEQANRFLVALDQSPIDTATLHSVLAWLWRVAAGPVLEHLGHNAIPQSGRPWPRVWWVPTGALSVLPIHAAGHQSDPDTRDRRNVLDRVVSSYTPTAQLLAEARAHAAKRRRDTARGKDPDRTLVVGINQTPNLDELKFAEAEAIQVQQLLDPSTTALLGDHATHDQVASRLADARVSHFACHALADQTDPSRSHMALHDGPLPVSELRQLQLPNAELAYLSACTTANGSVRLLDESIHIASAFQLAGYPHVIATLWPINDYLAPTIAARVHAAIAAGTPPHLALHHTIRAVRDQPALRDHPEHWASHIHFGP